MCLFAPGLLVFCSRCSPQEADRMSRIIFLFVRQSDIILHTVRRDVNSITSILQGENLPTMIELRSREQVARSIERAKARHPRVKVKKFGEYQVTGSAGSAYI